MSGFHAKLNDLSQSSAVFASALLDSLRADSSAFYVSKGMSSSVPISIFLEHKIKPVAVTRIL
jgi:hypothetical protein